MILDFSLIVAIDSSAAHAIAKLKSILLNAMHLEVSIFVTGCTEGLKGYHVQWMRLKQALHRMELARHTRQQRGVGLFRLQKIQRQ